MEEIIVDNKKCEDLARKVKVLVLNAYSSHNTAEIENLIQEEAYRIIHILEQSKNKKIIEYDCEVRPVINSEKFIESYKLIVRLKS